jgi:hypothetical protein
MVQCSRNESGRYLCQNFFVFLHHSVVQLNGSNWPSLLLLLFLGVVFLDNNLSARLFIALEPCLEHLLYQMIGTSNSDQSLAMWNRLLSRVTNNISPFLGSLTIQSRNALATLPHTRCTRLRGSLPQKRSTCPEVCKTSCGVTMGHLRGKKTG